MKQPQDDILINTLDISTGRPNDFQTPPAALVPLTPFLPIRWTIWECAQGQGHLAEGLRAHGFDVIGTDILTGEDFMAFEPHRWDCIVTNPPFTEKDDFLRRAYQLKKPFAFLMPPRALEGLDRQALYKKHGVGLIVLDRRVQFTTPRGKKGGAWFPVCWFTHGLGLDGKLVFGSVPPHQAVGRRAKIEDLPLFKEASDE